MSCQEVWTLSSGDPLAAAAEKAWKSGLVVVAAAGNDGSANDTIAIPARNPYVIAVGASDSRGTSDPSDDSVAPFSSRAHGRSADLVAPGVGVVSVRVAGSVIDAQFPAARQGTALFRGNGTSQATAVVSGGAALLLARYPKLTPDQAKATMMRSTKYLDSDNVYAQGQGELSIGNFMASSEPATRAESAQRYSTIGGLLTTSSGGHAPGGNQPVSVDRQPMDR